MRRTFLITLVFSMLLVFSACRKESGHTLSPGIQRQVALLPADADVLGFLDIQAVQNSPFFDFITDSLQAELNEDEDFKTLTDELGLDPQKDIQRMYLAARFKNEDNLNILLVIEGNFQPDKILAKIEKEADSDSFKKTAYDKYKIYLFPEDKAFAFTDNRHIIAGTVQWVKLYLKNVSGSAPALNPEIKKRLKKLPYINQAWLLAEIGQWTKKIKQDDTHPRLKGLSSLKQFDFAMELNGELRFFSQGIFDDEEKCQLFHDALKGLIAAGKLAVSDDRSVVDILNKITIRNRGKDLDINFEISRDDLQKLLNRKKSWATKI